MQSGVRVDISTPRPPTPATPEPDAPATLDPIRKELAELRDTIGRLASVSETAALVETAPLLTRAYTTLIDQELDPDLARTIVRSIRLDLSERALGDPDAVNDALVRRLGRLVTTSGPLQPAAVGPRVLFLVGPTGVGKTTTLAKLAANLALDRQQVALVTTDTYRVAAIPQLQTYAEILGVPLEVVYTPAELAQFVAGRHERGYILVDTPGRSQYRDAQIEELGAYTAATPDRTVYLTVSATTRYRDLVAIADRFGRIPFDGVLCTKLDETTRYGALASLGNRLGKPLTYFTTGQNVPADIEVASPERLARLILETTGE